MVGVRRTGQATDHALKVDVQSAVLLLELLARIAHVLVDEGDEIVHDGFVLVKAFDCFEAVRGVHEISHVDARVATERTPA